MSRRIHVSTAVGVYVEPFGGVGDAFELFARFFMSYVREDVWYWMKWMLTILVTVDNRLTEVN